MPQRYEYELGAVSHKLVPEMFRPKPGENFVITADTESDPRVVDATAAAAFTVGARPMVIRVASPLGVGKAADPMLPVEPLTAALSAADAWVEFNKEWLLYSTPYEAAVRKNKKLRYMALVGMDVDMMIRVIGRVDLLPLKEYQDRPLAMMKEAGQIRVATSAGSDVTVETNPEAPGSSDVGYATTPGTYFLGGQLGPGYSESVDGSIFPPIGLIEEPVKLHVREGKVEKIEGGQDARTFEAWLRSFNDANMFRVAHLCFGCNPGAKLTGEIVEDERVWGSAEWGSGYVGEGLTADGKPIQASSHTDGICLDSSVWLDGERIMDKGRTIQPELAELAKKLGKN
jgi:leucyl aminopeptidase (aminopeptidase T)